MGLSWVCVWVRFRVGGGEGKEKEGKRGKKKGGGWGGAPLLPKAENFRFSLSSFLPFFFFFIFFLFVFFLHFYLFFPPSSR
jgi:hypothetical protein